MAKRLVRKIEPKHREFIKEYMQNGYNGTQAYRKIFPRSSYESARSSASDLLTNPNIQEELAKEFDKKVMKREEVLSRLSDMARASHHPFIEINEEDGSVYYDFSSPEAKSHLHLIKKIKTKRSRRAYGKGEDAETWEHEWVEVELHDAKDALKLIGQHEKLFVPDEGEGAKFTAPEVIELIKSYDDKRGK
jgi:phage terminase small subunit